jgi:restriction system protein
MPPLIEAELPASWQELEAQVAGILRECGYEVEVQKNVKLARGDVNIDVWADEHMSPPNVIVVECKHWATPATKNAVHGFRTVVGDSGANTGLLVSAAGFQSGAVEAAAYSNVRLLDWWEFQEMFAERWFRKYLSPTLAEETDALHEYTEPINSRIFRKADALPEERREQFKALRERHSALAITNFAFHPVVLDNFLSSAAKSIPTLPLRASAEGPDGSELVGLVPDEVLDATTLRPMMEAMIEQSHRAIAEFDEVFGERA